MGRFRLALLWAVVLFSLPALAAAQEDGDSAWQLYPARETARPLHLPAGAAEIGVRIKSLSTDQAFDKDGESRELSGPYDLFSADLSLRYSLNPHWEIFGGLPYLTGRIGESEGGGLGDVYLGFWFFLLPPDSPLELGLGLAMSFPTGDSQYHYTNSDEGTNLQNFRTGDPAYNYYPQIGLRLRNENFSFRLTATGIITSEGEVIYNRIGGSNDKIISDPGDGFRLTSGFYFQAGGRFCLGLDLDYLNLSETTLDGNRQHDQTLHLQLAPRIIFQASPQLDVGVGVGFMVFGQNTAGGTPVLLEVRSRF